LTSLARAGARPFDGIFADIVGVYDIYQNPST
jgi:hypothetical protein